MMPDKNPVRVILDEKTRDECIEYAETVLSRVVGSNYTGLECDNRYFVGRCGEKALNQWSSENNMLFEETVNDQGVSDKQDFLFYFKDGRVCRANIKNTLHPNGKRIMQPASQHKKCYQDVYVGASGIDNGRTVIILIWGVIARVQFDAMATLNQNRVIPTLEMFLTDMPYSMEHFKDKVLPCGH